MERAWMTRERVCFFLTLVFFLACGSMVVELYDFEDGRFDPDISSALCALGGALLCLVAVVVVRRGTVVADGGGLRMDAWQATLTRSGALLNRCMLVLMALAAAVFASSLYDFGEMRVDIDMSDALFPLAAFFLLSWLRHQLRLAGMKAAGATIEAKDEGTKRTAVSAASQHEQARMAQELEELKKKVEIDPLTGLLNKAALSEKIASSLMRNDVHCALFMVDMDNFKSINDTYGHLVGDEALANTGAALRDAFKGHEALIGRVGGDEFMALLFGVRDEEDLRALRDNLRTCLQIPIPQSERPFTGSIGCVLHEAGEDFESLYARADKLLYEDKRRDGASGGRA